MGNADLRASTDPNHQYLSLTGVIVDMSYVRSHLHPEMEALKERFFDQHPDDPIIFHRRELSRRLFPFEALRRPEVEAAFNHSLLDCISHWDYRVITVTIDKAEHVNHYALWRYHPYHYCLMVLVERYAMHLEAILARGDVVAEARGKKEDSQLSQSFARVVRQGTDYIQADRFSSVITTDEIKLKQKADNVAGLQLADMLAHPSARYMRIVKANAQPVNDFGSRITEILLRSKYLRNGRGDVWGAGLKWLPK